jgi:hypothetical protein
MNILYFSGFCLNKEQELFSQYQIDNDMSVSGFSYGAQKALDYVINTQKRVDLLQLFSPAFFVNKDKKYKRLQLMFFKKDPKSYCDNFLKNCGFTKKQAEQYFQMGEYEELEQLLQYTWDKHKLEQLKSKNIRLEVYIGSEDKIIDPEVAKDFFKEFGEVYFIKNKEHIL